MTEAGGDLALLRRFEPVVRSTSGDKFYPMDVEPYVRACSLWVKRPGEEAVCVTPAGELTLERLPQQTVDGFGAVHFLRFADPRSEEGPISPLTPLRRGAGLRKTRKAFRAGRSRLARVGYFSRIMDALYSIVLLARGRVPGEAASLAASRYERIMEEEGEHYRYHGRVFRQDDWVVLQYWFFYPFNDWRSGFFGANDHEADWESVSVYLSEPEGEARPEWVAYASHEYSGDDLRRRWDDPELEKVGEHPVVYVGAGSHASFYVAGEYLTEVRLPLPALPARAAIAVRSFWREKMRQYAGFGGRSRPNEGGGYLRIPFVDYARGDGLTIGEGGDEAWDPPRVLTEPLPGWVSGYRGLWGLYTRDPFEGEDAPSGPMYNRDESPRRAWYDPVGWAGLDKVPTSAGELRTALERRAEIESRCAALRAEIEEKSRKLKGLGVEVAAMRDRSHLDASYEDRMRQTGELSGEIKRLRARLAADMDVRESLGEYAGRLRAGERGPARAHLSRPHAPASDADLRAGRVAEVWAAASVGLMLVALVLIVIQARQHLTAGLVAGVAVFAFVEAGFRRRLTNLLSSANIGLAVVAALIVVYEFFWPLVVLAVLAVGAYVLWDNLRELRRR
ncbi:hypothetical protein GBA65_01485 [Rubrobacter marinus]|uniref:Uncharacterized protein n=1 Tax=Rubrobacter marinus TaxID=2653852 RepID=A0A6G8PSC7_9ACTN|nr:hypothetical protein [Rubrobacter marinus]QIN77398.1 hypothetical protein GBA65_01485 [Rubrobacter marinus]